MNYNVFYGGLRPSNPNLALLPSVPPDPTGPMEQDARASPVVTAKLRHLAWPGSIVALSCVSAGGYACAESRALAEYCTAITGTLAVGDTLDVSIIPAGTVLRSVYWKVDGVVPGLAYTVSYVNTTGATPTVTLIPTSAIDGAVLGQGLFTLAPPVLFPLNGLLRLTITSLPAATPANAGCRLRGSSLQIAPELYRPNGGVF